MSHQTDSREVPSVVLLSDFDEFAAALEQTICLASIQLSILSDSLDPLLFDRPEIVSALSKLARSNAKVNIRILVKDPSNLVSRRNATVLLAQRLPSKIKIKHLQLQPSNKNINYWVADRSVLLTLRDKVMFSGSFQSRAKIEVRSLLEEFTDLWERQSADIPNLRTLSI